MADDTPAGGWLSQPQPSGAPSRQRVLCDAARAEGARLRPCANHEHGAEDGHCVHRAFGPWMKNVLTEALKAHGMTPALSADDWADADECYRIGLGLPP